MKKIFNILYITLVLLFTIPLNAAAQNKLLTQGMYNITDVKLQPGISYKIHNISTNKSLLLIIDNNQNIQQLIRLEPTSPEYTLKPLNSNDLIIIIGAAKLEFS